MVNYVNGNAPREGHAEIEGILLQLVGRRLYGNRLSVCSRIKFNEPQLIVHDNTIKTFTKNYILFSPSRLCLFSPSIIPL